MTLPQQLLTRLAVVALALSVVVATASAQAACDFANSRATGTLNDFAAFKNCSLSVAFNPRDAAKTIETLLAANQLYAFRDIAKNAPKMNGLEHIQVDVDAELRAISTQKFTSEFEFQDTLSALFLRLKDPHTLYVKPTCFGAHLALQPLTISSKINSHTGAQELFIDGYLARFADAAPYKDIPFADFLGANLLKIDGVDALKTLVRFTIAGGYISKDRSAAFNQVLKSDFQQRYLGLYNFPEHSTQTYSLRLVNGTELDITIPWTIYSTTKVRFTADSCVKAFTQEDTILDMEAPRVEGLPNVPGGIDVLHEFKLPRGDATTITLNTHANDRERRQSALKVISQSPRGVAPETAEIAGFVTNSDVITLKIKTFSPSSDIGFLNTLKDVIIYAQENKVKYLTVDLIGNGGGSICLGYQVIHNLVSERNPEGNYDIIKSEITDNLVRNSLNAKTLIPVYGPGFWFNPQREPIKDDSWYNPGRSYERGDVVGNYSDRVFHACDYDDSFPYHNFTRVLILTDGLCGSTCAVFSSHLDEVKGVDTVAIGGITQSPYGMQYFSFPGGQVLDVQYIFQFQDYLRMGPPSVPRFPNDASYRFTAVEIYPWLAGEGHFKYPLEFVYRPAMYNIPLWLESDVSGDRLAQVYDETAKIFDDDK